jgi:hypothetical protein
MVRFILILVHDEGQTIFDDLNHLYNAWVLQTVTKILHTSDVTESSPCHYLRHHGLINYKDTKR